MRPATFPLEQLVVAHAKLHRIRKAEIRGVDGCAYKGCPVSIWNTYIPDQNQSIAVDRMTYVAIVVNVYHL